MKFTGERVVPNDMRGFIDTYQQHLMRYVWALQFVKGKSVLDAACGCGYGTDLMANVTTQIKGIDNSEDALHYAIKENMRGIFVKDDLNDPKHNYQVDTIVTFETIEHLDNPVSFLKWCKSHAQEVVGSIPINCKTEFHKHVYNPKQAYNLIQSVFSHAFFWKQTGLQIENHALSAMYHTGDMILFRAQI